MGCSHHPVRQSVRPRWTRLGAGRSQVAQDRRFDATLQIGHVALSTLAGGVGHAAHNREYVDDGDLGLGLQRQIIVVQNFQQDRVQRPCIPGLLAKRGSRLLDIEKMG